MKTIFGLITAIFFFLVSFFILPLLVLTSCNRGSNGPVSPKPPLNIENEKHSFFVQLQGERKQCIAEYCFYDMFDVNPSEIKKVSAQGHKPICYFSAGTYENWRKDSKSFPQEAIGRKVKGWKGENWLDIRNPRVLDIMRGRMQYATFIGCYGVDMDNVDSHTNQTGFPLTKDDVLKYLQALTDHAKFLKIKVGLKNSGSLANELSPMFDWVLAEQCLEYNECDIYAPFAVLKKPIFNIEYMGNCINHPWIQFAKADLSLNGEEWELCQ